MNIYFRYEYENKIFITKGKKSTKNIMVFIDHHLFGKLGILNLELGFL